MSMKVERFKINFITFVHFSVGTWYISSSLKVLSYCTLSSSCNMPTLVGKKEMPSTFQKNYLKTVKNHVQLRIMCWLLFRALPMWPMTLGLTKINVWKFVCFCLQIFLALFSLNYHSKSMFPEFFYFQLY
jgi:hypothetical protein